MTSPSESPAIAPFSGHCRVSIIVPALNEEQVIGRCLEAVAANDFPLEQMEVILVDNGSKDRTIAIARSYEKSLPLRVLERKGVHISAMRNAGAREARGELLAFLDADCQLSENLLGRVAEEFEDPDVRIVAPGVKYIDEGHNPFLAGYYHLWRSLPYVRRNTMARGFYAIDQRLRERYVEFPSLIADDKFIRNLTKPDERRVAKDCFTTVYLPANFKDLLKVKTRWTFGNLELAERRPDLNVNDRGEHDGAMRFVLARPWLWVNVPTFLFVWWYAKRAARKKLAQKRAGWERDESTRMGTARVAG